MIAIKDMKEIPSGCDRCRLYPVCKHRDVYNDNYKPTDCPLVEIVTCKDCKYFERLTCLGGQCVSPTKTYINETTNDFYCADGK